MSNWFIYPSRLVVGDTSPHGVCRVVADCTPRPVITAAGNETITLEQAEENARLIAVSQELLETLVNLRTQLRIHHKMNVKKDYSLMLADAAAGKVIFKIRGNNENQNI